MTESPSSTSLSEIECMIEDLYDDSADSVVSGLLPVISVAVTEKQWQSCHGSLACSKSFKRGCFSWFEDYLIDAPIYSSTKIYKGFQIRLKLYWALHDDLLLQDSSLTQQRDALEKPGIQVTRKTLCSLYQLGSGVSFQQLDEISQMSLESQRIYFQKHFVGCRPSVRTSLSQMRPIIRRVAACSERI